MVADSIAFRNALGAFATGVTIVTTIDAAGHDVGLTASSFNSVSLDPPLVLWSLAKTALSYAAFSQAPFFAVHVLASDQQELSNRFASRGIDKFAGLVTDRGEGGVPLLSGSVARFRCRSAYRYDGGDHVICVGEVLGFDHSARSPLVFQGGRYAVAARHIGNVDDDDLGHLIQRAYFHLLTPVRRERERIGVSLHEHYLLSVLAVSGASTMDEVDAVIGYTGVHATDAEASLLAMRGLVERADSEGIVACWAITAAGREAVIGLVGAAKAIETDALRQLDDSERTLLKMFLRRLGGGSDIGAGDDARVMRHMAILERVPRAASLPIA